MIPGAQTVTLVSVETDEDNLDRKHIPTESTTSTTVTGATLVPVSVKEKISNIDYAISHYEAYLLPSAAAMAVKPDDSIIDAAGTEYHVVGAMAQPGVNGLADHVRVSLWLPSGLNAPPSDAY